MEIPGLKGGALIDPQVHAAIETQRAGVQ